MVQIDLPVATAFGAACIILSASSVTHATSASVGVSISFEVAPADLFRAYANAPADVRACEAMQGKINQTGHYKTKRPKLDCDNADSMPLIITPKTTGGLVVRP